MSEIQNDTSQSRSQDFMADVKNPMTEVYRSVSKQPYVSPTPGELPLIAIGKNKFSQDGNTPMTTDTLDTVFLEKIKSVGFNAVQAIIGNTDNMDTSIKTCNESGIKQIARISELKNQQCICSNDKITDADNDPKNIKGESYRHLNSTDESGKLDDDVIAEKASEGEEVERRAHVIGNAWLNNVKRIKDEEGCGGYQLCDEPSLRHFPWYAKFKDMMLEEHIDLPRSQQDQWGRQVFLNLLPLTSNYLLTSPAGMVGCEKGRYLSSDTTKGLLTVKGHTDAGYSTYLDEFENIFNPGVWCFDNYYLCDKMWSSDMALEPRYFASLDAIRKKSLKTDRPFWATIRCKYHRPEGYENDPFTIWDGAAYILGHVMNLETHCALAGGAKGLMFWSVTRDEPNEGTKNWAPIGFDLLGNAGSKDDPKAAMVETALFEYLEATVEDAKKYGDIFLNSTVRATCVTEPLENGFKHGEAQSIPTSIYSPTRIYAIGTTSSFYIARHETPSGGFLVCVNLDMYNPQRLIIKYNDSKNIEEITGCQKANTSGLDLSKMETGLVAPMDSALTARLVQPGGWCIFKW